jgi:hypothetical protein
VSRAPKKYLASGNCNRGILNILKILILKIFRKYKKILLKGKEVKREIKGQEGK